MFVFYYTIIDYSILHVFYHTLIDYSILQQTVYIKYIPYYITRILVSKGPRPLVKARADKEKGRIDGFPALSAASFQGHVEIVRLLLQVWNPFSKGPKDHKHEDPYSMIYYGIVFYDMVWQCIVYSIVWYSIV